MAAIFVTIGYTIRDGGNTPRQITAWLVRDGGNVQRTVAGAFSRATGNASELFFNPSGSLTLAVSAAPATVSGTTHGSGTVTTASTTATATGGTPPYTYAWNLLSYSSGTPPTSTSPSSDSTAFTQTSLDPGAVETAQWQPQVTDNLGTVAVGSPVTSIFIDNSV